MKCSWMKKNSATFSFQAEQDFVDYRDRLLDWQAGYFELTAGSAALASATP